MTVGSLAIHRREARMFARVWRFASYGCRTALCLGFAVPIQANELATEQQRLLASGADLFNHQWQVKDPRSRVGDGLGPVYNENSCAACHGIGGVGGGGPVEKNVQLLATPLVATLRSGQSTATAGAAANSRFPSVSASVLHRFGNSDKYTQWRENLLIHAPNVLELPSTQETDAADKRASQVSTPDAKELRLRRARGGSLTERNAAALFGDGLIDKIPDAVIKAQVKTALPLDPLDTSRKDARTSPVQGRVVLVSDGRVGKFGSKAQQASLGEFTLFACAMEIGLEVPNNPQSLDPTVERREQTNGLDMNQDDCDALIAFVSSIPAPRRETPGDASRETVMVGEVLFDRIGCAACHKPRLGDIDGLYSDLLVHDMGQELADPSIYYSKSGTAGTTLVRASEWRTPPLWGVADSAPYLHDGRARTLKEAILLHNGQASESANYFSGLHDTEQEAVLTFLRSLRAPQPVAAPATVTQIAPR